MILFLLFLPLLITLILAFDTVDWQLAPNDILQTDTIQYPSPLSATATSPPLHRRVSWFPYYNLAIINGDEIFGSINDLLRSIVSNPPEAIPFRQPRAPGSMNRRAFSVARGDPRLWENGTVEFFWADGESREMRSRQFAEAVKIWQAKLPWLKFVDNGVSDITWGNGPVIIRGANGSISASTIGKNQRPGGNYLLLGNSASPKVHVHEIGHLLGLIDEHQRPDRPNYLDLDCSAIRCSYTNSSSSCLPPSCDPSNCSGYGCVYSPRDPTRIPSLNASGPYDQRSVMQIPLNAFKSSTVQQFPLRSKAGGAKQEEDDSCFPSSEDAERVCALYGSVCTAICGNGVVEQGEECDDGNNVSGDGCNAACGFAGENGNATTTSAAATAPTGWNSTTTSWPGTGTGTGVSTTPVPTMSNSTASSLPGTGGSSSVPMTTSSMAPFPTEVNSTSIGPTNPTSSGTSPLPLSTESSSSELPTCTTGTTASPPETSSPTSPPPPTSALPTPTPPTCPIPQCTVILPNNPCGVRASCEYIPNPGDKHFCFCQAGYKAVQGTVQYRLPWEGQDFRVAVAEHVECDELCLGNTCSEVEMIQGCI